MTLPIELLDENCLPYKGDPEDAGWDLRARAGGTIEPRHRALIPCGIIIALEPGTVGLVKPRSGLAVKQGIDTMAGVIDSNYRGEIQVLLINHGSKPFTWEAGDRVAQLVIVRYEALDIEVVDNVDMATSRGSAGFGSSGIA